MKILGTIALIDEGETDWKVLAIDTRDPLAEKLNDIDDIQTHMPGFIAATVEWFKIYKMPDGEIMHFVLGLPRPYNVVGRVAIFQIKNFMWPSANHTRRVCIAPPLYIFRACKVVHQR